MERVEYQVKGKKCEKKKEKRKNLFTPLRF